MKGPGEEIQLQAAQKAGQRYRQCVVIQTAPPFPCQSPAAWLSILCHSWKTSGAITPCARDSGLRACSQAEIGSRPGVGWHQGQLNCPGSHMPLFGLNIPLPASALFSAQLAKSPLQLLFLPLFPNLDGPKAPQADKGKFIALCLWHCWNTLLPQILRQGSVGKAQCPQQGSTLTYICPSLLLLPCHCSLWAPRRCLQLWQSLWHLWGQLEPSTPALNRTGASAHPVACESPSARCHMDPMASYWPQALFMCLLCPQGV